MVLPHYCCKWTTNGPPCCWQWSNHKDVRWSNQLATLILTQHLHTDHWCNGPLTLAFVWSGIANNNMVLSHSWCMWTMDGPISWFHWSDHTNVCGPYMVSSVVFNGPINLLFHTCPDGSITCFQRSYHTDVAQGPQLGPGPNPPLSCSVVSLMVTRHWLCTLMTCDMFKVTHAIWQHPTSVDNVAVFDASFVTDITSPT